MKIRFLVFILLTALFSHYVLQAQENSSYKEPKKILIINSYHQTLHWSVNFEEGYKQFLYNNKYELYIEFLDAKRVHFGIERGKYFVEILNALYKTIDFDLILLTDDPALDFYETYFDELQFVENVPVIAAGINSRQLIGRVKGKNISIIEQKVDAVNTIRQIHSFFPDVNHIFIVSDYTVSGIAIREQIFEQIQNSAQEFSGITFSHNENLPFPDIIKYIESLSPATAILLASYYVDSLHTYYPNEEVVFSIQNVTDIPVFCLLDTWITNEVIGGHVNRSSIQGILLGKEAVRKLFANQDLAAEMDTAYPQNQWIFNYPALKSYHLLDYKLPEGAIVINQEDNEIHKRLSRIFIIFSVILLAIVVIIYIANIVLKKKVALSTQNLQKEIDKFEFFVSEMPIGYIELDDCDHILVWNKSAEHIFGFSAQEALGANITRLLSLNIVQSNLADDFKENATNYRFDSAVTKSGYKINCEWYLTNYQSSHDTPLHFMMVIDITEKEKLRKNLEIMLDKTKEVMLQNDRYMASNMHDIKNLLLPIVTYSEMMMVDGISLEKMKSLAEQLNKSASGLVDLSTGILNISKVRGKLMNVDPEEFNIYTKIQDILIILEANFAQKNISVHNKVDPHQLVYADSELINSVLLNLLGNAIKFTPPNGTIRLFSSLLDENTVEISVKDSGVGVDESIMEDIFTHNRYFSSKGTEGEVGSGLGLILCKDLLEKNNGSIRVENNKDESGATFSFILPVHRSCNDPLPD